jgi:hypothetical protein
MAFLSISLIVGADNLDANELRTGHMIKMYWIAIDTLQKSEICSLISSRVRIIKHPA